MAEILFCKMLVIHLYENTVILKFQKLNKLDSFHNDLNDEKREIWREFNFF